MAGDYIKPFFNGDEIIQFPVTLMELKSKKELFLMVGNKLHKRIHIYVMILLNDPLMRAIIRNVIKKRD